MITRLLFILVLFCFCGYGYSQDVKTQCEQDSINRIKALKEQVKNGMESAGYRDKPQRSSFTIYTDEDLKPILQFSEDRDQNYTMGFGFGFSSPALKEANFLKPAIYFGNLLTKKFKKDEVLDDLSPNLSLNGTAFTPDELRDKEVNKLDRPYAFLLALSTKDFRLIQSKGKRPRFFTTEVSIGMLGLKLGQWVQTNIHKGMNDGNTKEPYLPEGWHNQISNGGEPTFLISFSTEFLFTSSAFEKNKNRRSYYELKAGYQVMGGWYTGGNVSATARVGLLDPKNWIQNFNVLGNFNKALGEIPKRSMFELYLYGSIRPSLILYNEMLLGGFRTPAHSFSWGQMEKDTLEWNTGIGLNIPGVNYSTNLVWALNSGRSPEFNTSMGRWHKWGSIYITFNY